MMNKNTLMYGLFAGAISSIWVIIMGNLDPATFDYDMGMVYGYLSMLVAFSLIFVAVKNYRDNQNNGTVTFGKAFLKGFYITVIASTVYVVVWLIEYYFFIPDFMEVMAASAQNKLKAQGASEVELQANITQMAEFTTMYKNPFINAAFTYTEILPVGTLVSAIAALILKRK